MAVPVGARQVRLDRTHAAILRKQQRPNRHVSADASERLNCSPATASRAIRELITYGFVEVGKASSFSKKRLAAEYRMTHITCDVTGKPPSKTFMRITANDNAQRLPARRNDQANPFHSFNHETDRFTSDAA
jgi:hypothetical protein